MGTPNTALFPPRDMDPYDDTLRNYIDQGDIIVLSMTVGNTRKVIAGAGLTGGGPLSADVTISMPNVGTAGSAGDASHTATVTTDAQGRVTSLAVNSIQITEAQVTNLTSDLAAKAPLASPAFTGSVTVNGVQVADISSAQTLTNKTLTSPRINTILDTNGNVAVNVGAAASAVNYLNEYNAATGAAPGVAAVGSDANINLALSGKGTGVVSANGITVATISGDLAGTQASVTVAKINGVAVTGTPTSGQVITATSGTAATWQTPSGGGGTATSGKLSVKAAIFANSGLSGLATIDGVTPAAGDRILCLNQTTGSQNGIWVAASGAWTRPTDFASGSIADGVYAYTEIAGSSIRANAGLMVSGTGITVDTTAHAWAYINGTAGITTDATLTIAGTSITRAAITGDVTVAAGSNAATVTKVNGVAVTGTPTSGQVITATSGTAANWQTPSGGGGGSSAFTKPAPAVGQYQIPWGVNGQGVVSQNPGLNTQMFMPLLVSVSATYDTLTAVVNTAGGTGNTLRLALYKSDGANNGPGSLVGGADLGTVSATTTGAKTLSFATAQTLAAGLYWMCLASQGGTSSCTLSAYAHADATNVLTTVPIPNSTMNDAVYSTTDLTNGTIYTGYSNVTNGQVSGAFAANPSFGPGGGSGVWVMAAHRSA